MRNRSRINGRVARNRQFLLLNCDVSFDYSSCDYACGNTGIER